MRAREPLRARLAVAARLGAIALGRQATEELPAWYPPHRCGGAFPSERLVACPATEGQSNRDIAQALFGTTKTVEVHLSACCRKLGINSRSDLAAFPALSVAGLPDQSGDEPPLQRQCRPGLDGPGGGGSGLGGPRGDEFGGDR
jgi:Bacterial regulatory proteins, luxR family